MGIFEALYGMFELYQKNPRILFYKKIYNLSSVTGTFINTNHFSGYLEMIIPLAIGLIIARIDVSSLMGLKRKEKMLRLSEKGWAINSVILLGILGMSVAIIYSKSRSGVFVLLFTFLLFFGLVGIYFRNSRYQRRTIWNFLRISLLALILISLFLGIGSTVERFSFDRILYESRPAIWANTIDIFLNYPFFGSGLGTFPSIYPQFETDGTLWHVFHAHNDYLEYLAELGILGFCLLMGGIAIMFISSFLVWRFRRNTESKGLALGGIVSIICILVHSFTDFNLHIPANMLLFSVVLSLTSVA
jgi:O-antigen ligase